ncbi:MAG TPA: hypothetical protein PKL84_09270, partial [Candidatus Hydrogenedentes bacterium]|nr:hypothetical protein [Candidatus Hydrogenedentota bacterium]
MPRACAYTIMHIINWRLISRVLSAVAAGSGAAFLPAVGWALYYGEYGTISGILTAVGIAWIVAGLLSLLGRRADDQLYQREALIIVVFSWVLAGSLGAL